MSNLPTLLMPGSRAIIFRAFYASLALFFGSACTQMPVRDSATPVMAGQPSMGWVQQLGKAQAGSLVDVPVDKMGTPRVRVAPAYQSASGRRCRQLQNANGRSLQRLVCQGMGLGNARGGGKDSGKLWHLSRSLDTAARVRPALESMVLMPAAYKAASAVTKPVVPAPSPTAQTLVKRQRTWYALNENETIWALAKRVTGNANHWQQIAEHNRIASPETLLPGVMIEVPDSLLKPAAR